MARLIAWPEDDRPLDQVSWATAKKVESDALDNWQKQQDLIDRQQKAIEPKHKKWWDIYGLGERR